MCVFLYCLVVLLNLLLMLLCPMQSTLNCLVVERCDTNKYFSPSLEYSPRISEAPPLKLGGCVNNIQFQSFGMHDKTVYVFQLFFFQLSCEMYIYIVCKERLFSFFLDELQPRFCQCSVTCWRCWRGTPSPSCCTDVLSCDADCLFSRPSHYSSTCSPVLMLVTDFLTFFLPATSSFVFLEEKKPNNYVAK